jgi:predicted dehydrogenase
MSETKAKLRVGLIGCGGISGAHLPHLSTSDDVELAAFCDIIVERAEKHAKKYGGNVYDDAAKMLKNEKLDAAYILIPTYAHGAPERACLAAGVPFLCEKPLGLYPDDLRKLSKEVQASGLICSAGFMNRYRKSVNRAKELFSQDTPILMDGAWIGGPPLRKEGDYFANAPIGQWWPIKSKSGGQMVEQVIHTVDLVRYIGGEVVEVSAFAARNFNQKLPNIIQNYDLDDAMVMSVKFASGGVANLMSCCSAQAGGGVFLNVWASSHTAKFNDWAHHVDIHRAGEPGVESIKGDIDDIFPAEDRAFINAIKSGDPSGIKCLYPDGVRSTLLALAGNESLETGKPVTVKYE